VLRRLGGFPVSGPQAMAGPAELKNASVMDESVDNSGSGHCVGKDLRPLLEGEVRRECDACGFVALRNDLEEQVGGLELERDVAQFVDKQQAIALQRAEFSRERPVAFGIASRGTSKSHAHGRLKTARLGLSDVCRNGWLRSRLRLPVAGCYAVLVQAVALTPNLDEVRMVHQSIEKCRNRRCVAEELGPIVERAV
jgi:hypothetical protein